MKPHVIRIAKNDFREHYGVALTDEQVGAILALDEEEVPQWDSYRISATSLDTFDREILPYLLCKYLKIELRWPCNGDSDDYTLRFWREFELAAAAFGIEILS